MLLRHFPRRVPSQVAASPPRFQSTAPSLFTARFFQLPPESAMVAWSQVFEEDPELGDHHHVGDLLERTLGALQSAEGGGKPATVF